MYNLTYIYVVCMWVTVQHVSLLSHRIIAICLMSFALCYFLINCFMFLIYLFYVWQKVFDRVNWTKLMQILTRTGIDWRERNLISKLYMSQRVKVRLDRGETRSVQIGRSVRRGCCSSLILFNLYSEYITNVFWMVLETSTLDGKLFKL